MMSQEQLKSHIQKKEEEKQKWHDLIALLEEFSEKHHVEAKIHNYLKAQLSSAIAFCDISIRDHSKDLNK